VTESETILRIAAKGDGITASGRHAARAAPGDVLHPDESLSPGPHRAVPPCRHFGTCGGCQLQHVDEETLTEFVYDRVANAAEGQGLVAEIISAPVMSPPYTRRRASLKAVNGGGRALMGFNEAGSHRLVDLKECHVLHPALFAAAEHFKRYFSKMKRKFAIGIELSLTDQGVDCRLSGFAPEGLAQTEDLLDLCRNAGLARLSLDHGYGPEGFWEPEPVTVTFAGVPVSFPPGAFMQATAEGEAALVGAAMEWLAGCGPVADLFAGLGTFALPLAKEHRVIAAEGDRAALLALKSAAGRAKLPLEAQHRDLFRNPLRPEELNLLGGVVLDPPRAGARSQIEQLAVSNVKRIVYISCNPSSWSRDGAMLTAAGYKLAELRPVGQFRWSTHVELASLFVK
jgi:23S rRNA (uracil1939-C5)-methyltransferase